MSRKSELESKLTLQQRKAALLLVENELGESADGTRRNLDEIAQEAGCTRMTLYRWSKDNAAFIEYKNALADEFLSSTRDRVYRQLMRLIDGPQPSVKAIDLYMRRFGLLTDNKTLEVKDGIGGRDNADIAKDLAELDELLADGNE